MRKNKRKHRLWGLVLTFGLILGLLPSGVLAESDEGHTHTDACYCKGGELICGAEESAGHTHDESCYETVTTEDGETEQTLICGETESEGHTHTADCYCAGGELICGQDAVDGEMGVDEDIDAGFTISEEEEAAGTRGHAEEMEEGERSVITNAVDAYVSNGEKWVKVGNFYATGYDETKKRYYVYADELDEVFGPYGFDSKTYNGEKWFPNTDYDNGETSASKIWGDSAPTKDGNRYKIWLTVHGNTLTDLFYTPNIAGYLDSNNTVSRTNAAMLAGNKVTASYYTVRITDPHSLLTAEETALLPDSGAKYAAGKEYPITLPIDSGLTWTLYDGAGNEISIIPTSRDDTTATYRLTVDKQYEFRATAQEDVHCFVQLDGKWVEIEQLSATKQMTAGGQNRFYISAEKLGTVYGKYGFDASTYTSDLRIFPHTTANDANQIWFDGASQNADGKWWIPLSAYKRNGADIYLYYVPGNKDNSITTGSKSPVELLTTKNSFYSIRATNPANLALAGSLPEVQYKQGGTATQITLPKITAENGEWTIFKDGETVAKKTAGENSDKDTVTYTITNLSGAVTFVAMQEGKVTLKMQYQAAVTLDKLGQVSYLPQPTKIVKNATDSDVLLALAESDSYKVAEPTSYIVQALCPNGNTNSTRTLTYSFKGWEVEKSNGDKVILQPNQPLTREQLLSYSKDGQVTLKAIWKGVEDNGWIPSTNFYVNLNCEIKDNKSDGVQTTHPSHEYTASLFATRMLGMGDITDSNGKSDGYCLFTAGENDVDTNSAAETVDTESAINAYVVDSEIRAASATATNCVPGKIGNAELKFENFPTDAEILAQVQAEVKSGNKTVMVDGQPLSWDKLTTDHFKVRWYVVKYQNADGWHVDGVLVAKEAHFIVTMQFAGNETARQQVKDSGFQITVSHEDGSGQTGKSRAAGEAATYADEKDFTLMLTPKNQTNAGIQTMAASDDTSEKVGYTSYNGATDTYTWELTAHPGRQYTIQQKNQTVKGYTCSASYVVVQPTGEDTESEILANDYANVADKGIQITAHSYANDRKDLYQKIEFVNSYTASAEIPIKPVEPGKDKPVVITPPDNGDNGNNNQPDKPDNGDNGNNTQPDTPSRPSHSHKPSKADNQPSEPDTKPDTPSEPDNRPSEPDTKPDTPSEPEEQPDNGNQTDNGSQTITQPDAAENTADVSNTDTAVSVDAVPQTGDPMNPVLWASMLGISLAGLGAAFVLMKKKQNR